MKNLADQVLADGNPLAAILHDYRNAHVGYVYGVTFTEALVLTNDAWKERVGGIPHNCFLIAASFDPEKYTEAHEFDREVLLLRVLGPATLPTDTDFLRTRIEHNQRRTGDEVFDAGAHDGHDPITLNELQYGGIRCRILGTFYVADGQLRLGSDLENYMAATRLRVFKPSAAALERIVNHVNPEVRAKAILEAKQAGFDELPLPLEIGTVRYTSTARLHRGAGQPLVPVMVQPSDFFARRTAVLGMTRTGKSNTVKTQIAAVVVAAKRSGISVGQLIFDVNGEYANANHQDDGSSLAEVFAGDTIRYRAVDMPGTDFQDLRTNFYAECAEGITLLCQLTRDDPYRKQTDLELFLESGLEEPDVSDASDHSRWRIRKAIFQCILHMASYPAPSGLSVTFPANAEVLRLVAEHSHQPRPAASRKGEVTLELEDAVEWFVNARSTNYQLQKTQEENNERKVGLPSSTAGRPWVDTVMEGYLNVLARQNANGTAIRGYRAIAAFAPYHSPRRSDDVVEEILEHLAHGKIVILDLSAGPAEIRTVLSERIARQVFQRSIDAMNRGRMPPNVAIYVEEAHNLISAKADLDSTWPRIAKEGAKARISFVYATQEPSSIHPNILANTENWYVTHLNNDDELKALGKFYDFKDFQDSLKSAQDVGFARIKTLSSPFVVPTQIHRFTPEDIRRRLAAIEGTGAAAAKRGRSPARRS